MDTKNFGIAAIVASILIPLCQIFAPLGVNIYQEGQKQKLEFVKLYVEYEKATDERQIEIYSKLRLFFPKYWKEYQIEFVPFAKTPEVLNAIKKTEFQGDVVQVTNSRTSEMEGFKYLEQGDLSKAKISFKRAFESFPKLHNVSEIYNLLDKENLTSYDKETLEKKLRIQRPILRKILDSYSWGMPQEVKKALELKIKS